MKDNPRMVQRRRTGAAALLPGLDKELADVAAKHTDLAAVCGEGETVLTSQRLVGLWTPLLRAQPATLFPSCTRAAVTRVLGLLALTTLGEGRAGPGTPSTRIKI